MTKTKTVTVATNAGPATIDRAGLLATFGARYNVDPTKVMSVLKQTCFRTEKPASDEQMMALLVVANEYELNPFTREIYAFEDKHKGIVPIVPVDGWVRIVNRHPALEGLEFEYGEDEDSGPWVECIIHRKDRTRPTRVREYLVECKRNTGPWDSHPRRMLRHKALMQAARVAFGLGGIFDPDEAAAFAGERDVTPRGKPRTAPPQARRQPEPVTDAQLAEDDGSIPAPSDGAYHTTPTADELRALDAAIVDDEQPYAAP
jgi:phage recombination protein Bet